MDSANNSTTNAAAAAGKRMAEAINPSTAVAAKKKSKPTDQARIQARLEANRKAARESRRRKKVLVEELQRSVRILDCVLCWSGYCLN